MGRRRRRSNANMPPNLYSNGEYFRYRDPRSGKYFSLGKDRAKAFKTANALNAKVQPDIEAIANDILAQAIEERTDRRHVVDRGGKKLSDLIDEYVEKRAPEKGWSKKTEQNYMGYFRRYQREIGNLIIAQVTTNDLSNWMDGSFSNTAYIKHRALVIELFNYACARGYRKDNPASVLLVKRPDKKARQRLPLGAFLKIHEAAPDWLQRAMMLSLITLQREGDICKMRFDDIREDDNGIRRIYVVQQKTHTKSDMAFLAIRVTPQLDSIIKQAKRTGIASPLLVHRRPDRIARSSQKQHWTQVLPKYVSDTFKRVRDELGLFDNLTNKERPTFHEIRALGIHLYKNKLKLGEDYTQSLAGHSNKKMTELYAEGHEVEYNLVDADLDLEKVAE